MSKKFSKQQYKLIRKNCQFPRWKTVKKYINKYYRYNNKYEYLFFLLNLKKGDLINGCNDYSANSRIEDIKKSYYKSPRRKNYFYRNFKGNKYFFEVGVKTELSFCCSNGGCIDPPYSLELIKQIYNEHSELCKEFNKNLNKDCLMCNLIKNNIFPYNEDGTLNKHKIEEFKENNNV